MHLRISIDLENFYDKQNTLINDIKTVRQWIYDILDKNQNKHRKNLYKMIKQYEQLDQFPINILKRRDQWIEYLDELDILLITLNTTEQKEIDIMENTMNKHIETRGLKGFNNDFDRSKIVASNEAKINNINLIKRDVIDYIVNIKSKIEDMSLRIDNLCFDNIVMLDTIVKNFGLLYEL